MITNASEPLKAVVTSGADTAFRHQVAPRTSRWTTTVDTKPGHIVTKHLLSINFLSRLSHYRCVNRREDVDLVGVPGRQRGCSRPVTQCQLSTDGMGG